ncbi:MAG: hypothetical protein KKD44_21475 [Proteobacteria bacterium]|nr:hypothetical protein [Pseudomonadota bacterium]
MIVIPKETPLITNLNSYYLNIDKLFEHYQGVVDSGCIYFKSPSSEGVVFFDEENLINGTFRNKTSLIKGKEAIDLLMGESGSNNFSVSIYEIIPERITYWANLADAEDLHKDLSTEFTDLDSLIKKMVSEKLTGYIDVTFNKAEKAVLFLLNGEIIGTTTSEDKWQLNRTEALQQLLIDKSRTKGAILNVKKIPLKLIIENYTHTGPEHVNPSDVINIETILPAQPVEVEKPLNIMGMLQHLMLIYEKFIVGNRKIREDFDTILKRKFMEKVDRFDFLDPFAAEFMYSNGKITYTGNTDKAKLASGLVECLNEIAGENGMQKWLKKHLGPWEEKYLREIEFIKNKA